MNEPLTSALYVGSVRHRRHRPVVNAFRYRTYHVLVDVAELPRLDRQLPGFGYNRAGIVSFHDRDHLGPDARPVREKLAAWLAEQGVDLPPGPVRVLTDLRVLGHVFSPVSWWFCHDRDGALAFVVAEVDNTFGQTHRYLLDDLEVTGDGTIRARAAKSFRVSPFLPIAGLSYRFVLRPPGRGVLAHVTVDDAGGTVLDATQVGHRVELTGRSLARVLVTHPLMPLRTLVLIHLQAVRLWLRRVPFLRGSQPVATVRDTPRSAV